jgi:PAS domain S-box-containing protein
MKLKRSEIKSASKEFKRLMEELPPEKAKIIKAALENEKDMYRELLDIISFVNQLLVRITAAPDEEELFRVLENGLSSNPKYHGIVFLLEGETLISPYSRSESEKGSLLEKLKAHAAKQPINLKNKRVRLYKDVVFQKKTVHCTVDQLLREEMLAVLAKVLQKLFGMNPEDGVISTPVIYEKKVLGVINITAPYLVQEFIPVVKNFSDALANTLMHKRAIQALQESEEKFRTIVTNSQAIIFMLDKDGVFLLSEGEDLAALGLKPGEAVGMSAFEMYKDYPECIKGINHALSGSVYKGFLYVREACFDIFYSPFRNPGGDVIGVIGMAVDITERRKAEEALRKSEAKFRELFETSKDMIYISNKERVLDVNLAGVELLGYPKDEILSMKIEHFYAHPEDRRKMLDMLDNVGYVKDHETDFRKKDGAITHVLVTSTKKEDKAGIRYEGIIRNITDQKKLEAQLLQAQKMEAVGTLAGGIAHDFNNIIGIIMGNAELIQMNQVEDHPCFRNIKSIYTAAVRAKDLTQQILAFSRQDKYNPSHVDVNGVIKEITKMISETFDRRITINTNVDPDVDAIYADAVQVHQVILNLCTNSRDAMPAGGILTIKAANVAVDDDFAALHGGEQAKGGQYLRFTVSDTGEGMDENTLEHVFDPFFTTKEVGKGTGLGLSTVYGIAKRHGGFVTIHSVPAEGTTVSVYFPCIEKVKKTVPLTLEGEVKGGTETVLIADDEAALRDLGRIRFESQGYRVLTAADGEQALEMIRRHIDEIDLIILDYNMPKKSGEEVLEEAYQLRTGLKVIMVSGLGDKLPSDGVFSWINKIVAKPYPTKELLIYAREILDSVKNAD